MAIEARGTVNVGGTVACMARVRNVDTAAYITPSTVSTITYSIYSLDESTQARTAVSAHSAVSVVVASSVYDTLQTTLGWDDDTTGFNFRHVINISSNAAFATVNTTYVVEFTITPTSGQKILVPFKVVAI
jgi:hypothetical protein